MIARQQETIIVGAGVAGLACARRLHEARRSFLVISEDLGGRVRRSRDGTINLGAYYVRADYTYVNAYVRPGRRINHLRVHRHDAAGRAYTYWNRRLLLHLPQAARFLLLLREFRRHHDTLKRRSATVGQATAIRSDPLLWGLYRQPACEFIAQHRIRDLSRWYLEPALHGTTFTPMRDITAFTLLLGSLTILVPTYEFTLLLDRLVDGFADALLTDIVTAIKPGTTGYRVEARDSGAFLTERVVIATPTHAAERLLGLPAAKRPTAAHMFQVAGTLRDEFRADLHLFPESDPTLAIARQDGGAVLFASWMRHPDFDRYFEDWRVVEHRHWNPAFHIAGDELLDCEQGPDLYLVGDHNIVGLEEAYITGLYAANQIISHASNGSSNLLRIAHTGGELVNEG